MQDYTWSTYSELRYTELALTKLKQLKDRSLAVIEIINGALSYKYSALSTYVKRESITLYVVSFVCMHLPHLPTPTTSSGRNNRASHHVLCLFELCR